MNKKFRISAELYVDVVVEIEVDSTYSVERFATLARDELKDAAREQLTHVLARANPTIVQIQ